MPSLEMRASFKSVLLIGCVYLENIALRLTPKSAKSLPKWIENELMDKMDAESFHGMKYAEERNEEREAKNLD